MMKMLIPIVCLIALAGCASGRGDQQLALALAQEETIKACYYASRPAVSLDGLTGQDLALVLMAQALEAEKNKTRCARVGVNDVAIAKSRELTKRLGLGINALGAHIWLWRSGVCRA